MDNTRANEGHNKVDIWWLQSEQKSIKGLGSTISQQMVCIAQAGWFQSCIIFSSDDEAMITNDKKDLIQQPSDVITEFIQELLDGKKDNITEALRKKPTCGMAAPRSEAPTATQTKKRAGCWSDGSTTKATERTGGGAMQTKVTSVKPPA